MTEYLILTLLVLANLLLIAVLVLLARRRDDGELMKKLENENDILSEQLREMQGEMARTTTAAVRDLAAVLAAYAMENPIFAKTVSAKTVTAGQRYLRNHNKLLWMVDGADGDETVVVRTVYPTYRGALVVCQGGDRAEVKLAVTEAVAALTGLSADRITVAKWQ